MKKDPSPQQNPVPVLSLTELQELGKGNVAYMRRYIVNGKMSFALHAADGAMLAVQDSEMATRQSAWFQELDLVTLH